MAQPYKYLNSDNHVIVHVSDGLRFYPKDNAAYLSWASIPGNVPDPADPPSAAEIWAAYQASAKAALAETDTTVARVSEAISLGTTTATTADVVAFMQYRKTLRAILTQAQPATIPAALPTKPAYPAGT